MLAKSILECDGIENKFMGDGVLALFRGGKFAERAVDAAFCISEKFDALKAKWNEESNQDLGFLGIGVGIATDRVIFGAIGTDNVRDFTVIGTAVNMAAFLEQSARNGRTIVVDHRTFASVRHMIGAFDGPENFPLQKPGQAVGIMYKKYVLRAKATKTLPRLFVSYATQDRPFVENELAIPLRELGVEVWYDAQDVPKGAVWPAKIGAALENSHAMVVIVSRHSKNSEWVRLEVDVAMSHKHLRDKITPVRIDETDSRLINPWLSAMQEIVPKNEPHFVKLLYTLLQKRDIEKRVVIRMDETAITGGAAGTGS
jgi:hypothetical protein